MRIPTLFIKIQISHSIICVWWEEKKARGVRSDAGIDVLSCFLIFRLPFPPVSSPDPLCTASLRIFSSLLNSAMRELLQRGRGMKRRSSWSAMCCRAVSSSWFSAGWASNWGWQWQGTAMKIGTFYLLLMHIQNNYSQPLSWGLSFTNPEWIRHINLQTNTFETEFLDLKGFACKSTLSQRNVLPLSEQ